MHEEDHTGTILLARTSGLGEISMCGCGIVSLHLGSITLRLETKALLQVEHMIQEALDSLCEIANQRIHQQTTGITHVH